MSAVARVEIRGNEKVETHLSEPRSARWQCLLGHVRAADPRVLLKLLMGAVSDETLKRYAQIPVETYLALGADRLPIDELAVVGGGAK